MTRTSKFWDRIAERYSKQPIKDEAAYQKKLEVTREYLHTEMHVLEIGCGTGSTALEHAPFVKHVRATDFSPKMIEIAKAKAASANISNVSFEVASAEDIEPEKESLDAVLALSVLHLLEDRRTVIANVYDALKNNGVFVTSTACLGDMSGLFKVIAPVGKFLRLLPHLDVFTAEELESDFRAAGFDIEYTWAPGKNKALFIIAKKPER